MERALGVFQKRMKGSKRDLVNLQTVALQKYGWMDV